MHKDEAFNCSLTRPRQLARRLILQCHGTGGRSRAQPGAPSGSIPAMVSDIECLDVWRFHVKGQDFLPLAARSAPPPSDTKTNPEPRKPPPEASLAPSPALMPGRRAAAKVRGAPQPRTATRSRSRAWRARRGAHLDRSEHGGIFSPRWGSSCSSSPCRTGAHDWKSCVPAEALGASSLRGLAPYVGSPSGSSPSSFNSLRICRSSAFHRAAVGVSG